MIGTAELQEVTLEDERLPRSMFYQRITYNSVAARVVGLMI